MKPHQLATLLNISSSTLRLWAGHEYASFLSPAAVGLNGAHRAFTEQDARILAWVASLRAQNVAPKEIISILRAAQDANWHNLPPLPGHIIGDEPIAVVPREAVEERVRALESHFNLQIAALERERDDLQQRLSQSEAENRELRQQLMQITNRLLTLLEQERHSRSE